MQIAADYGWEEGDAASLCAVFSTAFPQFTQPFLSIFCSHWYQAHYTGDEKMSLDQITWDLEGFKSVFTAGTGSWRFLAPQQIVHWRSNADVLCLTACKPVHNEILMISLYLMDQIKANQNQWKYYHVYLMFLLYRLGKVTESHCKSLYFLYLYRGIYRHWSSPYCPPPTNTHTFLSGFCQKL